VKPLVKSLLAIYLVFLLWLILFKTSIDVFSVLQDYQSRSLNLIPFFDASRGDVRGMIENALIFIPLGLLLSAVFTQARLWPQVAFVFSFSMAVEITQFVLAIGTTDITDVIMNTSGGLIGLGLYALGNKWLSHKALDGVITVVITALLILLLFLRFFVFKVRY
jgi:glycopeptide antibiotics resistance protein